jgi:hypothetical protein
LYFGAAQAVLTKMRAIAAVLKALADAVVILF